MKELIKALIKAKGDFPPIVKDKKGARSRYASLDSVLSAVEPVLLQNGLVVVQAVEGDTLKSTLYHVSGDSLSSVYPLPSSGTAQEFGGAITYARRYSLCALLSVTADEDDDGATGGRRATAQAPRFINPAQLAEYNAAAEKYGWGIEAQKALLGGLTITSRQRIPNVMFDHIMELLATQSPTQFAEVPVNA
jgi:hypothetical protein